MYADLDFKHPEVIKNIYDWAEWFVETTGICGFRLDAIKHIDSFFMSNFIRDMKKNTVKTFMFLANSGTVMKKLTTIILKRLGTALT